MFSGYFGQYAHLSQNMLFWALLEKRGVVFFATFWHKIVQKSPFSGFPCFLTFFGSFLTHFRSKSPKLPQIWYMGYFKNILQISYVQERHTSGSVVPGLMWQNWTKRDSLFWARGRRGHPYCSFVYPLAEGPKIPQNSPKHPILTPFWTPILGVPLKMASWGVPKWPKHWGFTYENTDLVLVFRPTF